MALLKKIFTPLIVPLALSLLLHGILIAAFSGLGVFYLIRDIKDTPLTALLISENKSAPIIARPAKVSENIAAQHKPSADNGNSGDKQNGPLDSGTLKKSVVPEDALPPINVPDLSASRDTHAAGPAAAEVKPESGPAANSPAPATGPAAVPTESRPALLKKTREKLFYSLYWLDIYVGRAEIDAVSAKGKVTIRSQVHSAPFISAFYKVDDYAESMVVDGMPVKFRIKQHEGKYRSDKETVFDPAKKHVTYIDYIKRTTDDYPMIATELWDLISGFYYLRRQPFEVGKSVYVDIFDSNKFFTAEVNVIGKERLKFHGTEHVDTVKVKPVLKSEGLFQNKGDILIWLTDDDNKTPVKIEAKVPIGKVVAILKSLETER